MRNGGIIIATASEMLAEWVGGLLGETTGCRPVIVSGAEDCMKKIKIAVPGLLFIEYCLKGADTAEMVFNLSRKYRNMRIAVWTATAMSAKAASRYVLSGAESFLDLRDGKNALQTQVREIVEGKDYCPKAVAEAAEMSDFAPEYDLKATKREREVIRLTATIKNTEKIAAVMGITDHTVRKHRRNIYQKCDGNTLVDLLIYGLQRGIISGEDF